MPENCVRFGEQMVDFFENDVTELDDGVKKPKEPAAKKEDAMRRCPICTHVHQKAPSCPECGTEYPRPKPTVHLPGELSELALSSALPGKKATMEQKQAIYSQLLYVARARGYLEGWVAHKYRALFDVWPRGMEAVEQEPSTELRKWIKQQLITYRKGAF